MVLRNIDVVILAGGFGTRLNEVNSGRPKILVPFGDKPFIEIIINSLTAAGFNRIILFVGYIKTQIIEYFQNRNDCEIVISEEEEPLGTGGALKNAQELIKSNEFITLNGDSFCDVDYKDFHSFHVQKRA